MFCFALVFSIIFFKYCPNSKCHIMGFMWKVSQLLPTLAIILKLLTIPSKEVNNPLLEETLQKSLLQILFLLFLKNSGMKFRKEKKKKKGHITASWLNYNLNLYKWGQDFHLTWDRASRWQNVKLSLRCLKSRYIEAANQMQICFYYPSLYTSFSEA